MIKKTRYVFKHFLSRNKNYDFISSLISQDLLPGVGFAEHLSQMQEKRYVLNLNCYCDTTEYVIKGRNRLKAEKS